MTSSEGAKGWGPHGAEPGEHPDDHEIWPEGIWDGDAASHVSSGGSESECALCSHEDSTEEEVAYCHATPDAALPLPTLEVVGESDDDSSCCELGELDEHCLECPGANEDVETHEPSLRHGWRPGWSSGSWVSARHPLAPQSQVLVANVVFALRRLPEIVRFHARDYFQAEVQSARRRVSSALMVAERLLCVSASRIWRTLKSLGDNCWEPKGAARDNCWEPKEAARDTGPDVAPTSINRRDRTLVTLVRAALSVRTARGPARAYQEHVARLAVEGVDVGEKCHTRVFF